MMKRLKVIGAVPQLPDDIIFEILKRVSCARSLWKFRCVCKSWCSLISSTNFIQAHLDNSLLTSNFTILSTIFRVPTRKTLPLSSLLAKGYELSDADGEDYPYNVTHRDAIELDCSPIFMNYDNLQLPIHVISTCNGLCLMQVNQRDFYLWNPFIKQGRKLPDFVDHTDLVEHHNHDNSICIRCGAFGFDERTHDYNIVAFIQYGSRKNTTKVYSFKTDSWTRSEDFECSIAHGTGKFLNGEFHWLLDNGTGGLSIVSLELTSQVQRAADLPNKVVTGVPGEVGGRPTLSVHGGCLYVVCVFLLNLDVWVLQDNNGSVPDSSSWVKVASMPRFVRVEFYGGLATKILCVTEEGEFLLSRDVLKIALYNPKDNCIRLPRLYDSFPHSDICVQSLVSPFPDGMVKKICQTRKAKLDTQTACSSKRTQSRMGRSSKRAKSRSSKHTKSRMPFLRLGM